MPAELVPLEVRLLEVARHLHHHLRAAAAVVGVVRERTAGLQRHKALADVELHGRDGIVPGREGAHGRPFAVRAVRLDLERRRLALHAQQLARGDAVRKQHRAPGAVDGGIGDVAHAPLRHRVEHDHHDGGAHVVLARAEEADVLQLHEAEARIGLELAIVASAEAVDRDGHRAAVLEHLLHREEHLRAAEERRVRDAADLARRALPLVHFRLRDGVRNLLPRGVQLGELQILHDDAEVLEDLRLLRGREAFHGKDLLALHGGERLFRRQTVERPLHGLDAALRRRVGETVVRRGLDEVVRRAVLQLLERARRADGVVEVERAHEGVVRPLALDQRRVVHVPSADAGVREAAEEERLERPRDRRDAAYPVVQLDHEVALHVAGGVVLGDDLLRGGYVARHARDECDALHGGVEGVRHVFHHGTEVEADVGPGLALLHLVEGGENKAYLHGARLVGNRPGGRGREKRGQEVLELGLRGKTAHCGGGEETVDEVTAGAAHASCRCFSHCRFLVHFFILLFFVLRD